LRIRSPWLTRLIARLAVSLLRALFRTVRIELRPAVPEVNVFESATTERFLFCTWHDSILMPIFAGKSESVAALVSRHQDGSYLAEAMKLVGITPVRGSTNRGGAAALKQLMTLTKDKHITITPDGPRGPRRAMKGGIVFLASQTGRSIVPTLFCCRRAWIVPGSWTDLIIPKPFSTMIGLAAAPISVPADLSRQQLNEYMERVQQAMDALSAEADRLTGPRVAHTDRSNVRRAA